MLDLGLSFIHVVGPIRSIQSFFLEFFPKLSFILFDLVHSQLYFSLLSFQTASYLPKYVHAGFVQLLVMHDLFQIQSREERNKDVLCRYRHNI